MGLATELSVGDGALSPSQDIYAVLAITKAQGTLQRRGQTHPPEGGEVLWNAAFWTVAWLSQ